jgi:hypothetical protein
MFPKLAIQVRRVETLHDTLWQVYLNRTDGHYWLGDKMLASYRTKQHALDMAQKLAADDNLPVQVVAS